MTQMMDSWSNSKNPKKFFKKYIIEKILFLIEFEKKLVK